jgi:hypothetical protein
MAASSAPSVVDDIYINEHDLPPLHNIASTASLHAQKNLLQLTKLSLFCLSLGAMLSAIRATQMAPLLAYSSTILLSISILISLAIEHGGFERRWYDGRALAESIKTLAWKYMMKAKPYDRTNKPEDQFSKDVLAVMTVKKTFATMADEQDSHQQITDVMRQLHAADLATRKNAYLHHRIHNQQHWYSKKTQANHYGGILFFWLLIKIQIVAIFVAILAMKIPGIFNPTGALTTMAAGVIGWMQMKRFRELTEAYRLTRHELGLIEDRLDKVKTNEDFSHFVHEAELAISREHTTWIARTA